MATTAPSDHWVRLDGEDGDGTIEAYELCSARRALALLKARIGRTALVELLHDDIAAGDTFLRDQLRRAAGRELTGTTVLRARGIGAAQFGGWLAAAFGREDVLLAAHPEHYSIHQAPGRDVNIVETLGDHICSFFMRPWNEAEVSRHGTGAGRNSTGGADGGGLRRSHLVLGDGTVVGSISTGFQDTADGLVAQLSVTLPDTCAPMVEQHLEHFAVEFRTWILRAAAETAVPGA